MTMEQLGPKLYNWASILDEKTREQAEALANLDFVYPHIALMPDAHHGKGSAVGTVIPTKGAVIPAAVGVDIGCGMSAVRTSITKQDIDDRMAATGEAYDTLRHAIERVIPMSPGNYNHDPERFDFTAEKIAKLEKRAADNKVDLSHTTNWRNQLGSLGGGNHFIEVCFDESDHAVLFLHSGSRGVGKRTADVHIAAAQAQRKKMGDVLVDRDHAWLEDDTDEFWTYIDALHWAQDFAYLNRGEMLDRFRKVFGEWLDVDPEEIEVERIATHHNYTVATKIDGEDVWLTRKGAVDASEGMRCLIPGSMGTASYIGTGLGNEMGLWSAPHGAGRVMSRTEAKKTFTEDDLREAMKGIEFTEQDAARLIDEIPASYKDIDQVMKDAESLVRIDHKLRQVVNCKGTK